MPKTKQPKASIAKDCFSEGEWVKETALLQELMDGERTHLSFDLPLKLRKAFKWATRHNKQTMCPVLQDFIMAYVSATKLRKDCFNNTLPPTFRIDNLVIPSYERLKFRRHYEEDEEIERTVSVTCGFADCTEKAIAEGVYKGNTVLLCPFHLDAVRENRFWSGVHVLEGGVGASEG